MAVLSDPIADFLTRVKNAGIARNAEFAAPYSRIKAELARILEQEGYIWGYEVIGEGVQKAIKVKTKFSAEGKSIVTDVKRCSKPGRRHYVHSSEIPVVMNGLGISIVSTSAGLMTGAQARKQQIGGELVALVW